MKSCIKFLPIAVALALSACGGKSGEAASSGSSACGKLAADESCVLIGSAEPTTGGIAHWGKGNEHAIQLAFDEINAKGLTIGGKKVKLGVLYEDDAADPKQGPLVAQKLVDAGVVGVVGHLTSGVSIPASSVYSAAGVVQVSPSSTNPDYTLKSSKTPKGSVSAYRVVATDTRQAPALGKYMLDHGAKNVAVLDDATQYGKGLSDEVAKVLQAGGAKVAVRESATDKTADFKAVLTQIKAQNPDFIFWGGMDDTAATLVKQMKELGISAKLVGADGVCTAKFIELAAAASRGVVCSQAGMPLEKMAKGVEFDSKFKKAYPNEAVQVYAPFAYDAAYAIVEAMKLADSTDREAIAAAMPKVNFEGLIGPISFDDKGDIKNGAVTVFEIADKPEVMEIVK